MYRVAGVGDTAVRYVSAMGQQEIIAEINKAWGEIKGFPQGVDEMPEDLKSLRAQSHIIAARLGYLIELIDQFDPEAQN